MAVVLGDVLPPVATRLIGEQGPGTTARDLQDGDPRPLVDQVGAKGPSRPRPSGRWRPDRGPIPCYRYRPLRRAPRRRSFPWYPTCGCMCGPVGSRTPVLPNLVPSRSERRPPVTQPPGSYGSARTPGLVPSSSSRGGPHEGLGASPSPSNHLGVGTRFCCQPRGRSGADRLRDGQLLTGLDVDVRVYVSSTGLVTGVRRPRRARCWGLRSPVETGSGPYRQRVLHPWLAPGLGSPWRDL